MRLERYVASNARHNLAWSSMWSIPQPLQNPSNPDHQIRSSEVCHPTGLLSRCMGKYRLRKSRIKLTPWSLSHEQLRKRIPQVLLVFLWTDLRPTFLWQLYSTYVLKLWFPFYEEPTSEIFYFPKCMAKRMGKTILVVHHRATRCHSHLSAAALQSFWDRNLRFFRGSPLARAKEVFKCIRGNLLHTRTKHILPMSGRPDKTIVTISWL